MSGDLYRILELKEGATRSEIKNSYRRLAQKHHPDKNENNPIAETIFKAIKKAFEILYDPVRRKKYDETGDDGDVEDITGRVKAEIQNLIFTVMDGGNDPSTFNVLMKVDQALVEGMEEVDKLIAGVHKKIRGYEKNRDRFVLKGEGENYIARFIDAKIKVLKGTFPELEKRREFGEAMREFLADYEYEVEEPDPDDRPISQYSMEELNKLTKNLRKKYDTGDFNPFASKS